MEKEKEREPRYSSTVVCVGVGLSGIALGAHLKLKYGISDIRFYEREAAIGGTWLINSYPGMSLLSLSSLPSLPSRSSLPLDPALAWHGGLTG